MIIMKKSHFLLIAFMIFSLGTLGCGLAQSVVERAKANKTLAGLIADEPTPTRRKPTPRPTFTVTPTPTDTATPTPTDTPTPIPTDTPTLTLTPPPTPTPAPTDTPAATATPAPTNTVPRPTSPPRAPTATFTPAPPTATAVPNWTFKVKERGDRNWQKTTYTSIVNYVYVTDNKGTPIGGIFVVGEHSSGKFPKYKSPPSEWKSFVSSLSSDYRKTVNLKVELGPYVDGTWYVYLVDGGGTQLSDKIAWDYSSDPNNRMWDFIWWSK